MEKLKKSIFIVALSLTLVVGLISFTEAAQAVAYEHFPDVPLDAPYAEAVDTLAEMGIVRGDENGNFNPDNTITRAEFATMMCRLLGVEDEALAITKSSFSDVPSNHWACGYVTKIAELGLVNGYGDGRFGPSDTLTYEQAVKVLICSFAYAEIDFEAMAQNLGGWPNGYIRVADEIGLSSNINANVESYVSRGNVATLCFNYLYNSF